MKISVIAIVLAAALGAYGIVHYSNSRPQAVAATDARTTQESVNASQDVQRLEAALMTIKRELEDRGTPVSKAQVAKITNEATATAAPDPRADLQAQIEAERQFEEHTATIAANFNSESRDPRFAINAGDSLRTVLGSEELATVPVQNIDCRTSTCKVEITDDGTGIVANALPMLAVRMADTLPNVIAQRLEQPNGSATMILYMSR